MGKEMNKKQMCASVCLTRIPFFSLHATGHSGSSCWDMNLYNVFPEVEAMAFSSDVTDHVAPNQIRMKQGEKNKQTPNGKQGPPPLLLEIAATVPPISSSLYV